MEKKIIDSFKAAISWLESKVLYGTTVGYDLDNEPDTNEDRCTDLLEWEIEKATKATKAVTSWIEWNRRKNKINRDQMDEIANWYKRYELLRAENPKEFEGLIPAPLDDAMYYLSKQLRIYDKMKRQPDEQTRTRKRAPKRDIKTLRALFKDKSWFNKVLTPQLEVKSNKKRLAAIAYFIYEGTYLTKLPGTFTEWHTNFCRLLGCTAGQYYPNDIKDFHEYKVLSKDFEKSTSDKHK